MAANDPHTAGDWWRPRPGLTWQWQLSEPPVDISIDADVYDIDVYDNDASVVRALHDMGRKVIGYVNVGSWEDWRPDKDDFPPEVLGKDYEGWPGERWLDIRRIDLLAPIIGRRFDLCLEKGFDAIEPDNMEITAEACGFPITDEDRLRYVTWLTGQAHQRGLAIGMKNDFEHLPQLLDHFDFAILEDYFVYGWAEKMLPFIRAGKAVFAAEYDDTGVDMSAACRRAKELGFSVIQKHRILTSYRVACREE
jgi:hypothetical protein